MVRHVSSFKFYMKKTFLILFAAAFAAVSCAIDGGYSEQYQYVGHFEFNENVYEKEFGTDSIFFNVAEKDGFGFGDIAYYHKLGSDNSFQGGFLLSCLKPTGLGDKKSDDINSYRVAGKPLKDNLLNTYAVYVENKDASLMPADDIKFRVTDYGTFKVSHCWVNNTEEVYEAVKKIFENGDKLTLTASGYLEGAPTGTAEIILARPDTTMYNWTKFNLEKLGMVDKIEFQLSSSRSDLPKAFCLDELTGMINIQY